MRPTHQCITCGHRFTPKLRPGPWLDPFECVECGSEDVVGVLSSLEDELAMLTGEVA
jgi:Zn ribbon nucleic-acid-binding protein